ncbi:MAG TPA: hypothetical protein PKY81_07915 [bacterium]|nr:hypothetical protein [bacterium]
MKIIFQSKFLSVFILSLCCFLSLKNILPAEGLLRSNNNYSGQNIFSGDEGIEGFSADEKKIIIEKINKLERRFENIELSLEVLFNEIEKIKVSNDNKKNSNEFESFENGFDSIKSNSTTDSTDIDFFDRGIINYHKTLDGETFIFRDKNPEPENNSEIDAKLNINKSNVLQLYINLNLTNEEISELNNLKDKKGKILSLDDLKELKCYDKILKYKDKISF